MLLFPTAAQNYAKRHNQQRDLTIAPPFLPSPSKRFFHHSRKKNVLIPSFVYARLSYNAHTLCWHTVPGGLTGTAASKVP
jgi:hypothetical protein